MADPNYNSTDPVIIARSVAAFSTIAQRLAEISASENHGDRNLDATRIRHGFEVSQVPKTRVEQTIESLFVALLTQFPEKRVNPEAMTATYEKFLRSCDANSNGKLEGSELEAIESRFNAISPKQIFAPAQGKQLQTP